MISRSVDWQERDAVHNAAAAALGFGERPPRAKRRHSPRSGAHAPFPAEHGRHARSRHACTRSAPLGSRLLERRWILPHLGDLNWMEEQRGCASAEGASAAGHDAWGERPKRYAGRQGRWGGKERKGKREEEKRGTHETTIPPSSLTSSCSSLSRRKIQTRKRTSTQYAGASVGAGTDERGECAAATLLQSSRTSWLGASALQAGPPRPPASPPAANPCLRAKRETARARHSHRSRSRIGG